MDRELDDVDVLLGMWADWMRHPEALAASYPDKASGGFIPSWCKDTEEAAECADAETIARIDAAFDSLLPRYKDVIYKHYSLSRSGANVWRFAHPATMEDAKAEIRALFVKKGLL